MVRRMFWVILLLISSNGSLVAQTIELHLNGDLTYKDPRLYKNLSYWVWGWDLKEKTADGDYIIYYDSTHSTKYMTGTQKNGKREGQWIYYHSNGLQQFIFPYRAGKIEGNVYEFSYCGDTLQIGKYRDGKIYHLTKWRNAINYELPSEYPEFISESSDQMTVTKYFERDGRIGEIDTHNYVTNIRHDCFFDLYGRLSYEYFDFLQGRHQERSVVHYWKYPPDSIYGLSVYLQRPGDWKSLDSISMFPQLQDLYVEWESDSMLSATDVTRLNFALTPLIQSKKLKTLTIRVKGKIPPVVFELTQLTELTLWSTESINPRIGNLRNLESLEYWYYGDLRENPNPPLSIPRQMKKLDKLYKLNLKSYVLRDSRQLGRLKGLKSLRILMLDYCGLHEFPAGLTKLKNLHCLYISGEHSSYAGNSHITFLPESFINMSGLKRVTLPLSFPDSLTDQWRKRKPLTYFDIQSICFTGNTQISMADGTSKPIDEIEVGDIVLAFNFTEDKIDTAKVTHLIVHEVTETQLIILKTGSVSELQVTPNHPVWTHNAGFIPAFMISEESRLMSINRGTDCAYSALRCSDRMITSTAVFNFGTTKNNYFANGILVHNK